MAGTTGLEPAASAVTGQRSNQLNYVPTRQLNEMRIMRLYTDCTPCIDLDYPAGIQVVTTLDPTATNANKRVLQKYPNSFRYNGKDPHSAGPFTFAHPGNWEEVEYSDCAFSLS